MHIEKNVLESILNTLLMNDKSKDTAKARQDLEKPGHSKWLVARPHKTGECRKLRLRFFTPADKKKVNFLPKDLKENSLWLGSRRDIRFGLWTIQGTPISSISCVVNGVEMSADVARGHGGDGGGDDRPPPYQVRAPKAQFGWQESGQPHTHQRPGTSVKAIPDKCAPVLIWELPLHYPSWRQMLPERKAGVVAKIGTQFDLRPHMESDRWPQIYAGIQQHLQKIYNGKKAALKERYWVPEEDGTYDLERSDFSDTSLAHC
ncbi:hypothetical protein Tco_0756988 [Tanacetum coccineum]